MMNFDPYFGVSFFPISAIIHSSKITLKTRARVIQRTDAVTSVPTVTVRIVTLVHVYPKVNSLLY
jgi:hypothetical protein